MKVNPKFLMMMAALAGGAALAAPAPTATSAGTTAGTVITNTATASFTDPSNGSSQTADSNTVSTTVTPITGFDITYGDGSADGTTANSPATTYDKADVKPGDLVFSTYSVLNNSNIGTATNGYVINITPDTTGTSNAPTSVKYYPAGTTAANIGTVGHTEISSVALSNGQMLDIVQVITIPTAALPEEKYSASPKGTAPASTDTTAYPTAPAAGTFAAYLEATNNTTTGDLEYTRATVNKPVLNVLPPTSPNGTPPASPTNPTTPGPTPPPITTTPPLTYTPPVPTTPVPGTTTNPGTVIGITGDNQDAYPKADANTDADVVTFFSKVENKGNLPDTIYVKPTLPAGATSVTVLDKDGNVLTAETAGPNKDQFKLPGGPVAKDGTVEYRIVVVYPDSDSKATQADIAVPVNIYSGNVPMATPKTSTFTIHPPQMSFGDTTGTSPNTVPNAALTPTETVDPSSATTNTTQVAGDRSAVFPMTVKNNGTYGEAFTLSGTVDIKNRDGSTSTVAVTYYEVGGGTLATAGETPVILAGKSYDVLAVINVPATALATTGAAGANPEPKVSQIATGKYSGDSAKDELTDLTGGDIIKIIATGKIGVAKFVAKASVAAGSASVLPNNVTNNGVTIFNPANFTPNATDAAPNTDISYQIIAKNTYNSPASSFYLSDTLNTNTTFVSLSGSSSAAGTIIYSNDGNTWTTAAPTTGTTFYVAIDGPAAGNQPGDLPADATLTMNFVVKVK